MVYQLKRTQINKRPQAFWGSLIPSALSFVGGLITSSQQAKAQRRALEEQQRLAKQQLDISNQNQLASTLNNYVIAQQSYDDKDYNLKYRIGGVKRLGSRNIMITDGGNAKRIGNNTYLLRGGSHEDINETGQTGIGINVGGNEIEAEGGEVAQRKGNSLRIYSTQPILGGISPAEAIMRGYNKDKVFNAQQRFKKNNGIKDDGNKAQVGGYYGVNYPSPLSLLSILYDKTLGRFDDKNPNLQTGIAPTPSRSLNLKQVRGGLVNRNMLRTNRVYRITDMREVKDAKAIGQYRKLPEGVTLPTKTVRTRSGRTFTFGKAGGNSHGGKSAAMGEPWTGTTSGGYNESKYVISTPSRHTTWSVGHAGSYSKPLPADAIKKGSGLWKKFDAEGNTGISTKRMVVYKCLGNGRYLRLPKSKYRLGGGLTSKDRGSSKHPYPSVSSKDFAGGNRSYPIPTKADAIDALRLAGLHGRSDVRSKVYSKYPELRKKARGGTKVEPYYDWARNTSSNLGISFIDPTYDYRTYYNSVTPYERNLIRFAPQGTHFTDIGKTPKHPTFSNESIYSNKKHPGGTWNGNVFVPNIWQFGNNGNKARDKYMKNSEEGYFNGRVNIFPKYRKKADFGTWVRSNRNNNVLANLLYESGIIDKEAWRNMLRDIHTFTGMGGDPYNTDENVDAVMAPAFGTSSTRVLSQLAKSPEASYTLKQVLGLPTKEMIRKRIAGDIAKRIGVARAARQSSNFRNYNIARMQAANAEASFSPFANQVRYAEGKPILVNTNGYYTTAGNTISRNAKNMTSGANPFLYAERTPFQIRAGLNRAFNTAKQNIKNAERTSSQIRAGLNRVFGTAKQGVKNAGQKVKDFGNKVRNPNTYRTRTGFEERYNPTLGAYEQYNTYRLKPWVKATAGAAGTAGVIGLGVGLSNAKSEDKNIKAQLDAKGQPISPYIARPQEPAKPQSKKSVSARKDTIATKPATRQVPATIARKDTTRTDTTKQVNKVVKRQVRTTPQYTGNTTKGNYQLHDGETKTINGVKYTRRGNTIINHKTNVGYIYDKNGNYTGQADYSKVGNFNQAFDAARAAGRNQFIYRAGKYNNYSTIKETNAKKEALNRRIGARRIAKRMGGLINSPVERFKCGGRIRPKATDGMLATIYSYGTNRRRLPLFAPIDITPRAIPNFKPVSVPTNTKTPFDPNSVPFLGNQSTFKPATQDYIGLGIDTLAALGSGMFTRSAYNKMNFDYALPNYVDESPVAFDTTYHNEAQRANIERNRLNARNLIRGNTASAQTSLGRMQQSDVDAMMETNKLLDEKSNKEVELRNQNAANEQQVRARNAAARNQYYQNVAQIKNAALEAKNNAELAKAQSIGADLSGLSQAWTNFAGSVESRYDNRQKEAIIAATAKDPAVLSNAVQFGYNFSPEVLAAIYNSTDDDNLKSLALSQLSTKNRLRYGIR